MIIYKITNQINGKIYIGKTIDSLSGRWSSHQRYAMKEQNQTLLARAMRKHGIENFTIEQIDQSEDHDQLLELEKKYIAEANSMDPEVGYNMTEGGEGTLGCKHTEEWKQMMSERNSGENNPMFGVTGEDHPLYNIPRTEEDKQKIRDGWTKSDYEKTEEHIQKWRDSREGWSHDEETKAQISKTLTGMKRPTDTCPKCGATGSASHLKRFHYDNCGKKRSYGAQAQATCPHCGKTGGASNIKRFHFDRCKMKTS